MKYKVWFCYIVKNSTISNTKLRENFHPFVPHGLFVRIWLNLKKCPGGLNGKRRHTLFRSFFQFRARPLDKNFLCPAAFMSPHSWASVRKLPPRTRCQTDGHGINFLEQFINTDHFHRKFIHQSFSSKKRDHRGTWQPSLLSTENKLMGGRTVKGYWGRTTFWYFCLERAIPDCPENWAIERPLTSPAETMPSMDGGDWLWRGVALCTPVNPGEAWIISVSFKEDSSVWWPNLRW